MIPAQIVETLEACRIVAGISSSNTESASRIAEILVDEGVRFIEISFTTPRATELIARLRLQFDPSVVIVGAGGLRTVPDVRRAVASGANFLASPGSGPEVLRAMLSTGKMAIPSVFTSSEIMTAANLGAKTMRLFPTDSISPAYFFSLAAKFPDIRFIPTGSIVESDVSEWLSARAVAVGAEGFSYRSLADEPHLRQTARALLAECLPERRSAESESFMRS
ncbi:bifunctional 4-hydroxy-2-oxoglutarate aldolase/2-dehydro-3-deoxy-phosphogluconate aldolase [Mycobacteroides abscessus]|uniref:bifunctional 4-hydroxy-2-oxoglutarate aldolase/2-dehydro-3-deoxy-phosphogluconate aldolase n=1 Tax=Mycobacteroides abscessus TaxID=36809 RepID=UPI000C256BEB|nr:bifunctional 4-hydroxy-2-oxoglutarate aldolase/2-dehydro-3-deoxy-phosphogluconate aldolase [Mycobacteroides abscessus]